MASPRLRQGSFACGEGDEKTARIGGFVRHRSTRTPKWALLKNLYAYQGNNQSPKGALNS
jgi:hypothetical protein